MRAAVMVRRYIWAGASKPGRLSPGMPMEPRVSDTQSRATMPHSSAKLSETIAKAWRDRRSEE